MANWTPSLNALRAFEAVCRRLSYSKAAEELSVTPGAVKQLVSKLEASVGATLIRRRGRGLELTPVARAALGDLSEAMRLIDRAATTLRRREERSRLLVTVESSFATAWLAPRLGSFRAAYPDVTVLIDSSQAVADVEAGEFDVAIRYGALTTGGMIAHRLFEDEIFPVCSPTLTKGPPPLRRLEDLAEAPLIHWDISHMPWAEATARWFSWPAWLRRQGAEALATEAGLYFSEYGQAVQAAIAGQGILLASWPILRAPVEAGLLVAPFSERVTTDIGYEVVTSPRAAERGEVAAFIDWILQAAAAESED